MGWIGVDLDGTLATYTGWQGASHIGDPIKPMVERVKTWLAEGKEVRIMTARAYPCTQVIFPNQEVAVPIGRDHDLWSRTSESCRAIQDWCKLHLGRELPITCVKDYSMEQLWDDRAIQVLLNTGLRADGGV